MDKRLLLSEARLTSAFQMFDTNGNGKISFEEVKSLLNQTTNENNDELHQLIKEIDTDGDGEISFKEFKKMMKMLT